MRKEQLTKVLNYIDKLKAKGGAYKDYSTSIELLSSRLLDYYTPDIYNKYKNITEEEYEELDNLFKDAIEKSDAFLAEDNSDNAEVLSIKKRISKQIRTDFLSNYYLDFKKVDVKSGKPFYEEMDKNKNKSIGDISSSKIYTDGLFLKDDLTVGDGDESITGTFIYETNYDPDKEIDALIKEFGVKFPEYKNYFQSLKDHDKLNELASITNEEMINNKGDLNYFFDKNLENLSQMDNFEQRKHNLEFLNANAQFILKLRPILKNVNDYSLELDFKKGTNLDRRNVAFTNVAKLLDSESVVANARSVAIEKNAEDKTEYQAGTFIEKTEGITIKELDATDEIRGIKIEDWDTVEAKRSLANLQVIDYICGNINRNRDNIKLVFDPVTKKLKNVVGINNEKSFAKEKTKEAEASDLEKIKVIDAEMAKNILAFEEHEFKSSLLCQGLSEPEVQASWKRVQNLQGLIKNPKVLEEKDNAKEKLDNEKLLVLSDKDWEKLSLNDLAKGKENIFKTAVDAQKSITSEATVDNDILTKYHVVKQSYNDMLLKGNSLYSEAKKYEPFMNTSKRYSNVLKGLEDYYNAPSLEAKDAKLEKLNELVDAYNNEKIRDGVIDLNGNVSKKLKGSELDRINMMGKITNFTKAAVIMRKELNEVKALKENDEKKVDEINATFRRGKYENYAKLYKDDDGKVFVNANILNREKENVTNLANTKKQIDNLENVEFLSKNALKKHQLESAKNYLESSIETYKKQLKIDYVHGVIPKEYYDYKMDKYEKGIFEPLKDEEMFAKGDPNSDMFKNDFQEQIKEEVDLDKLDISMLSDEPEKELENVIKNDQEEKLDDSDFEIEENDNSKEKENELDNSFELNSNFEDSKDSIEQ